MTNRDERAKWAFLLAAPRNDARDPRIRRLAGYLWQCCAGREETFCHLAHAMCRDGIKYETDTARTGGEDVAGLTNTRLLLDSFSRGVDDCDASARLFVALCLARNMSARMVAMWRGDPEVLAHVYGEVLLAGKWLPVECTLRRARVGDPPLEVPRERDGTWLR